MNETPYILIGKDKAKEAAGVLEKAFFPYDYFTLPIPDPEKRKTALRYIFRFLINYGIKSGEVHATSPSMEGVAIWLPSEKRDIPILPSIFCGIIPILLFADKKGIMKIDSMEKLMIKKENEVIKEPHWFLSMIGVDPAFQGKGHGANLIKAMIPKAEADKKRIYAETQSEKNMDFYKRLGFKVMDKYILPEINLDCWTMLR